MTILHAVELKHARGRFAARRFAYLRGALRLYTLALQLHAVRNEEGLI